MPPEPTPTLPHLPQSSAGAETLIRRFEADWLAGRRPGIDAYLGRCPGEGRTALLVELVHAELELRLKAGEPVRVEEYLARYPELANDKAALLDLITAECRHRRRREPNLSLGGYQGRFPHLQIELVSALSRTKTETTAMHEPAPPPVGVGASPEPPDSGRPPSASPAPPTVAKDDDQSEHDPRTAPPHAEDIEEICSRLAAPQQPDELGRLGPYRVLKVLGAGGMGAVFQAEDSTLQRLVALKVMLPAFAATRSARERFLREARAAAAPKHDHIVTIHQVGEDRGIPFLAMELLEGESLESRLPREGRPPLLEAVRIGREIAEALAAAHKRGLVHRDVKPANVWVEAGSRRVKILDFGLARSNRDAHLTQSGAILGTPGYMSPEQAAGKPADARSDLFSLGVVLYRMLTGGLPFGGHDMISILVAMSTTPPQPVSKVNADVPRPLADLVMRLLSREPAERPATAEEVARALADIEQGLRRGRRRPNRGPGPRGKRHGGGASPPSSRLRRRCWGRAWRR